MGRQMVKNGGNTFAVFTRNPRGGNAKAIDPADVAKFLELAREHEFGKIVAHAPYTLNACAVKENLREFAKETFADDLKRMEFTPGNYYNFHPGSHVGQGIEVGIQKIAEVLNAVLTKEQTTTVLLETMSGKGSEVGSRLCGLLEYSTTFAGNRQAFFGFFIDFFGVHILIEPTKIQKQRAREVLACVCLYHVRDRHVF